MQLIRNRNPIQPRLRMQLILIRNRFNPLGWTNNAKPGRRALIWIKAGDLEAGAKLD